MQQTYAAPASLYAGFWRRLAAIIIDGLIVGIPTAIILAPFGGNTFNNGSYTGFGLLRSLIFLAYFALMESSSYQATLGKMALGIKVTDVDGNRLTLGRALGRNAAKYISTLICFIGYIMAAFTERKQALHDMIASTLVVQKDAAFASAGGAYAAPASYGAPPPPPPSAAPPPPPPAAPSGYPPAAPPPAPETAAPPAPANPDIPAAESSGQDAAPDAGHEGEPPPA